MLLHLGLTAVGGLAYNFIEILWRGRTHWSMFLVGGVCFDVIGGIHRRLQRRSPFLRCGVCAAAVTAVEFVSGCLFNLLLGLQVWDYSRMRFHIKGQVCLLYSLFWVVLSGLCWPVYRMCRRTLERRLCSRGSILAEGTARI